jgi:hypothetical protein
LPQGRDTVFMAERIPQAEPGDIDVVAKCVARDEEVLVAIRRHHRPLVVKSNGQASLAMNDVATAVMVDMGMYRR